MTSLSAPSVSSVETWLQNVHTATHDNNDDHHNNDNNKRNNKRRRSISADDTAAPNKAPRRLLRRTPLSAMNGNAQPSRRSSRKGTRAPSRIEDEGEATPRKPRSSRSQHAGAEQEQATVRRHCDSRLGGGFTLPPAMPLRTAANPSSPTRSESSARSSQTTSAASQKSRATSPVKKSSDLLFAQHPVDFQPPADLKLPEGMDRLDMRLREVEAGGNIIPHTMKDLVVDVLERNQLIFPMNLDNSCQRPVADLKRELDGLIDIKESTSRMKNVSYSEAAWNDEVHSRLFRIALRPYPSVHFFNATTARICPEYLPIDRGSGISMNAKMVDYTVHLMPDEPLQNRILNLLNPLPPSDRSMTQTSYEPTRFCPTAFSVETKSEKGNTDEAQLQLGIWVAAHFAKMRRLLESRQGFNPKTSIPAHPVIIWNTDVIWIRYAVEAVTDQGLPQDGQSPNHGRKIWIMNGPEIPIPSTVLAGYKCMTALRCLADWAEESFRPWVENELLAPVAR